MTQKKVLVSAQALKLLTKILDFYLKNTKTTKKKGFSWDLRGKRSPRKEAHQPDV
jgi:hypothetical protein